jgi:hypothetical protein
VSTLSARVAQLLGIPDSPAISEAVEVVTALARVHTRGRGFTVEEPLPDVAAVIVTASARLASNAEQVDSGVGPIWTRGSFVGWSLAELTVLNARRGTSH